MSRKPAPRPDDPPEWAAAAVRFTFGAVLGLFLCVGLLWVMDLKYWYWIAGIAVVTVLVCGFLAAKCGDSFWESVREWWRW